MTFAGHKVALARDAAPKLVKREFTVEADPETMKRFEKFLVYVHWCAGVGHSTKVVFSIDGDGADRFNVEHPLVVGDLDVVSQHGGEFEWIR